MKFILAILLLLTIANVAMSTERKRKHKKSRKAEGHWCCRNTDKTFQGYTTSTLGSTQAAADDDDCVALQPDDIGAWHTLKDKKCCGSIDDKANCNSSYKVPWRKSRRSNRRKYRMRRA